jgi:cytochrome c
MKLKAIRLRWFFCALLILLSACSGQVNGVPEPRSSSNSQVETGRALIASYGCGSCHTIPGIPGADSKAAPPLDGFYQRAYIAGKLPNTEENLVHWIQNPQAILPGNAMPDLGVSADEARDIASYLYHQPTLADWIQR